VVRRDAAGGKYAVDMRMKLQSLIPAMEHAEEADLGTKVPWINGEPGVGLQGSNDLASAQMSLLMTGNS
jgi:hypothetical protein